MNKFTDQIDIMLGSTFEYSPKHLMALAGATLKAANEHDDKEVGYGMQIFVQTFVHMVTNTPITDDDDERILSDINVTAMQVLPIKAKTYAKAFQSIFAATIETAEDNEVDPFEMIENNKQLKGFLASAKACFELTWDNLNNEEAQG